MLVAEPSRPGLADQLAGRKLGQQAGGGGGERESMRSNICANLSQWALDCAAGALAPNVGHQNSTSDSFHQAAAAAGHHQPQQAYLSTASVQPSQLNDLRTLFKGNQSAQHGALAATALASASASASSPLTNLVTNHLLAPTRQLEQSLDYYFSDIWLISGDERTNKLPFIGAGPWKLIWATCAYLLLIKWLLPRLMRPFRAFELNWPIRVYNFFMVLSNMWAFYHGARILQFGRKCFGCETINHRDYSEQSLELLHYGWLFFLSRLIEWLDTIFFVLRKRERQVTKLHVFHHSFVPLISWTYLKYHPGYTVAFFPFVNSFVHSIMYTYYLLATFGPKIQPYLWWKRYLTSLQIAQFILIIIQLASIPLTGDETCHYPRGFLYVAFAGAILFLWLFFTYYIDTYSKSKRGQLASTTHRLRPPTTGHLPLGRQACSNQREGSSRSLSDAIDDAISCEHDHQADAKKLK